MAELRARELELQQALAASATQELPTPADLAELARLQPRRHPADLPHPHPPRTFPRRGGEGS
jgi:hypothetical protein